MTLLLLLTLLRRRRAPLLLRRTSRRWTLLTRRPRSRRVLATWWSLWLLRWSLLLLLLLLAPVALHWRALSLLGMLAVRARRASLMRIGRRASWSRRIVSRWSAIVLRRIASLLARRRWPAISGKRILPSLLLILRITALEHLLTHRLQALPSCADKAGTALAYRLASNLRSGGDLVLLLGGLLSRPPPEGTQASPGSAERLLDGRPGLVGLCNQLPAAWLLLLLPRRGAVLSTGILGLPVLSVRRLSVLAGWRRSSLPRRRLLLLPLPRLGLTRRRSPLAGRRTTLMMLRRGPERTRRRAEATGRWWAAATLGRFSLRR